ncbi:hypothetical protein ACWOAH_10380 [Vagococcus vulneris]|uniref:Uncharacterized protein n=1 Tax=Vagococcus vulneris TaxID=1977869 RepID=A0A429ZTH7_9ENTE|nr:hypothetical protein [Vagococcus vulneris]RST96962.1 hypothetical protein CBF37_10420 [Vagococcus vulneris]
MLGIFNTNKLAEKIAAQINDSEPLKEEIRVLKQDLAAKEYTIREVEKKIKNEIDKNKQANQTIAELDTLTVSLSQTIKNIEKKNKPINKSKEVDEKNRILKNIVNNLTKENKKLKERTTKQTVYIKAIDFISSKDNFSQLKDVFSHNLKLYMTKNMIGNIETANKLSIDESVVRYLKNGSKKLTKDKFDCVAYIMADYFGCNVFELVSVKQK